MAGPTRAQKEQQDRSFYILRLRGLHIQASMVQDPTRREIIQKTIDVELASIGAETQAKRQERLKELNRRALDGDKAAEKEYLRLTKPVKLHRNKLPF